jgi:choline kinase
VYINVYICLQNRILVYKSVNKLICRDVYEFVLVVNKKRIQINNVYRNVYIFYTFITIRKND